VPDIGPRAGSDRGHCPEGLRTPAPIDTLACVYSKAEGQDGNDGSAAREWLEFPTLPGTHARWNQVKGRRFQLVSAGSGAAHPEGTPVSAGFDGLDRHRVYSWAEEIAAGIRPSGVAYEACVGLRVSVLRGTRFAPSVSPEMLDSHATLVEWALSHTLPAPAWSRGSYPETPYRVSPSPIATSPSAGSLSVSPN
jgi:hypothetical protein